MFEVGFSELLMVGLVTLLVIGPEKLPKVARMAGFWLGKTRQTIANFQVELKQELYAEEMRQLLEQQLNNNELKNSLPDTESLLADIDSSLNSIAADVNPKRQDDQTT